MSNPAETLTDSSSEPLDAEVVEQLGEPTNEQSSPGQQPTGTVPAAQDDIICEKCGTARHKKIRVEWCLRCGYYPRLGIHVELDPSDIEQPAAEVTKPAKPGPLDFLKLVPRWAWALLAGVVALIVISILVRLLAPDDSSVRTVWSLSQLGIGFVAFVVAHVTCYVYAIMNDSSLNVVDIVLKPWAIWIKTLAALPGSFSRVAAGCWGLTAAILSLAVIGGIPYESLWDWGIEARPKTTLIQAITAQAGRGGGADNLEDAIADFAGKAQVQEEEKKKKEEADDKILRAQALECVIIGFVPRGDDDFLSLVLASAPDGQLRYVGAVTDGISPDDRALLNERMRALVREKPLVPCTVKATWLEPVLTCRVKFKDWTSSKRMNKPLFEKMMAEIER